jgi:DNA-binding GntR family transcriptional regulator
MSEESIYQTLSKVLLTGSLAPGTQLIEAQMAEIFGVTRERIRKVLHRLGHERLLDLIPNRGAFVTAPSLEKAREIYEARRIVEGGIVGILAERHGAAQVAQLREHVRQERGAVRRKDRARSIRLSGEFHVLLAQATGSAFVVRQMHELVSRTSMLVALFEPSSASHCASAEHEEIVDAIEGGDLASAVRAMTAHLSLIETRLQVQPPRKMPKPEDVVKRMWAEATQGPRPSQNSTQRGAARSPSAQTGGRHK